MFRRCAVIRRPLSKKRRQQNFHYWRFNQHFHFRSPVHIPLGLCTNVLHMCSQVACDPTGNFFRKNVQQFLVATRLQGQNIQKEGSCIDPKALCIFYSLFASFYQLFTNFLQLFLMFLYNFFYSVLCFLHVIMQTGITRKMAGDFGAGDLGGLRLEECTGFHPTQVDPMWNTPPYGPTCASRFLAGLS